MGIPVEIWSPKREEGNTTILQRKRQNTNPIKMYGEDSAVIRCCCR